MAACYTRFVPTIALLFITRGHLPHERLWTEWIEAATYQVTCDDTVEDESFVTVYVHAPPNYAGYSVTSFFRDKLIENRVPAQWANHTSAERMLLRSALEQPSNQRFVLISESCVPLYSANIVYLQLMTCTRSSIACEPERSRYVRRSACTLRGSLRCLRQRILL